MHKNERFSNYFLKLMYKRRFAAYTLISKAIIWFRYWSVLDTDRETNKLEQ